jgi:hypothetical protein
LKVPNLRLKLIFVIALIFLGISGVGAQESAGLIASGSNIPPDVTPVMVKNVIAKDNPDDAGGAVIINWDLSVDDHPGGKVTAYNLFRSENKDQGYTLVGEAPSGTNQYIDNAAPVGISYYYKIATINSLKENGQNIWTVVSESDPVGPIKSTAQWFDFRRINVFVGTIIICSLIIFYINRARSGKAIFIRKIAGLDAVDEAVGRATEMGKKIFFIPGISDMDNVQTLAGITISGGWPKWPLNMKPGLKFQSAVRWFWSPPRKLSKRPMPRRDVPMLFARSRSIILLMISSDMPLVLMGWLFVRNRPPFS